MRLGCPRRLLAPLLPLALILLAAPAPAQGEGSASDTEVAALRAEMARMQAQIERLQQRTGDGWTDQRRTDELKALVAAALADADTRAAWMTRDVTAGIDDKGHVFIQSADGSFKMNISGQIQFRYIYNQQDGAAGNTSSSGFQMRRAKLRFSGHIGDPKIYYAIGLQSSRSSGPNGGNTSTEYAYAGYKFDNGLWVQGGVFKLPYARQELISSKRQTAVDRDLVTEYFTLNYSDQVQVGYRNDTIKTALSLSDGANNDWTDFTNTQAHNFAVTTRIDWKLLGGWSQMKDELAWTGDATAAFLGGAFHYESNGSTPGLRNWLAWTVDGIVKVQGVGLSAAFFGAQDNNVTPSTNRTPLGVYGQASYVVNNTWAPYARYDWLDDDTGGQNLQAVTVGTNYFLKKHAAKFTGDVVYIFAGDNPVPIGNLAGSELSTGLGLTSGKTAGQDQFALRLQFQLLF